MREGIGRKDPGGSRGGRKSEESGIRQPDLRTSKRTEGSSSRVEEFERYGGRGLGSMGDKYGADGEKHKQ